MADNWYTGNAANDGADTRGWLLGHFIDKATGGVRSTEDVEVKWGDHPAGDTRSLAVGSEVGAERTAHTPGARLAPFAPGRPRTRSLV